MTENLVPIGRFSRMTRLSVKALRLYDEIGLLTPSWVDPSSGYRYYRPAQANRAEAIRILRSVDMPLDEIAEVLGQDDPEVTGKLLDAHRRRLTARLADQERMLRFLEAIIERKEGVLPYRVEVKEVPPARVATVHVHTNLSRIGRDVEEGFGKLMMRLGSAGVFPSGPPCIVYHDVIDEDTEGDLDICIPVSQDLEPDGQVEMTEIPGGSVAFTVHRGPYDEIGPAYHTLSGWIQDHGHEMAGPPREVYLNDPREVPAEELLTEIDWPIR